MTPRGYRYSTGTSEFYLTLTYGTPSCTSIRVQTVQTARCLGQYSGAHAWMLFEF